MKILVLSYEYPPIGGGGGVICKNISENLAKLGNQVTLLTTAFQKSGINNPESGIRNLTVIRLNALRKNVFESDPLEMLSWIRTTKRFIKKNPGLVDFDICMAHFVLPGGEVALWLKKHLGLPYVLISHGHEIPWVHPRQMFFFHLGAYFWIRKVCRYSAYNFIQTKLMKANIDRFLGRKYRDKNILIPNGVDISLFFPDYSRRLEQLRILFVGRLVLQKDPMTFLKAILRFSGETSDFEVRILGDGNLRKKMEKFVTKKGLTNNVKFFGKVSGEQMVEEYQSAHIMVAPSLSEGMSIAALEALSCGVYLIATRASGFEDMIRDGINGEFVKYRDVADLSSRMLNFFKYKFQKESMPEENPGHISIDFNWENISRKYQEILKAV